MYQRNIRYSKRSDFVIQILQGDLVFTPDQDNMTCYKDGYLIYQNGIIIGVYEELPKEYQDQTVQKYINHLIIPGFNDIHVHGPQWLNCGIGYSRELLEWLNLYTFPLESKFSDRDFAETTYRRFVNALVECGTTRASVFATRHAQATKSLIQLFRKSGLGAYVGKVNMDRNAMEGLEEETQRSIYETEELITWVEDTRDNDLVNYILTPRFVPSTTPELMKGLGNLAETYKLKVQSHLSENHSEINWVRELHPECNDFASVYYEYGLMPKGRTVMAHCVHNTEKEQKLIKDQEVMIAHCAASNSNLTSGMMPLRKYMNEGQKIGLASDVAGGQTLDMRNHIVETIKTAKLYQSIHPQFHAVTFVEAFYLATKGGGSLFGKTGAFEKGYEMDALIIDDSDLTRGMEFDLPERLERFVYVGSSKKIIKRMVRGKEIHPI